MNAPKPQHTFLEKAGRHVVKAGLALGALTGLGTPKDANAQPQEFKGVMAITGAQGTQVRSTLLNLTFDAANPQASKLTGMNITDEAVGQKKAELVGYDHIVEGNNILIHESDGIHVFSKISALANSGLKQTIATTVPNASTIEDFDSKDEYLPSEGATPGSNQLIAVQKQSGIIKTYSFVKDQNEKVTGLKLVAKTDLSTNDFFANSVKRVDKNVMMATNGQDFYVTYLTKDPQGKWSIILQSEFPDGVSDWSGFDRNPINPAPNGEISTPIYIGSDLSFLNKKLNITGTSDVQKVMNFGKDGQYQIVAYGGEKNKVKNNITGEIVKIPSDVFIATGMRPIIEIPGSPNTFAALGNGKLNIIKITSDNPLKVETYVIPQDFLKPYIDGKLNWTINVGKDGDGDNIFIGDNCETVPNPSGKDSDEDGLGDQCDPTPLNVGDFTQSETLPESGFLFLCNPGKIAKSINSNNGDDISFVNMAKGEVSSIQLIGQKDSKSELLTITIPAGFQIDANVMDGGVSANGQALKGTMVTNAKTTLTFQSYTNVKFTFTNLGVSNPPEDTGPTEKDAGAGSDTETDTSKDTNPSPDVDAGPTGTDATGTDTEKKDIPPQGEDTKKPENDTGSPAQNDAGSNPQGGNGAEISQQPPVGDTKPPEGGCDANGKPIDARSSAALAAIAGGLIATIRKRARENGLPQEEIDRIQ